MFIKHRDLRSIVGAVYLITGIVFTCDLVFNQHALVSHDTSIMVWAYLFNTIMGAVMISSYDPIRLDASNGTRESSMILLVHVTMAVHALLISVSLDEQGYDEPHMQFFVMFIFILLGLLLILSQNGGSLDYYLSKASTVVFGLFFLGMIFILFQLFVATIFDWSGSSLNYKTIVMCILSLMYIGLSALFTPVLSMDVSIVNETPAYKMNMIKRIVLLLPVVIFTFIVADMIVTNWMDPVINFFREPVELYGNELLVTLYPYIPEVTYLAAALGSVYSGYVCLLYDDFQPIHIIRAALFSVAIILVFFVIMVILQFFLINIPIMIISAVVTGAIVLYVFSKLDDSAI